MQHGAAQVLQLVLRATFSSEIEGEFFAKASASVEHIDVVRGEVESLAQLDLVKGADYSRQKAIDDALRMALVKIGGKIGELGKTE